MLLISEQREVRPPYQSASIKQIEPAFDSTFVILYSLPNESNDKICHIDKDGKMLAKYTEGRNLQFMMISESLLIASFEEENYYEEIDIKSNKSTRVPLELAFKNKSAKIVYFSRTGLVCCFE